MVPERFSVRGKKNPKPKQDTKDLSKSPLWTHTHTSDLVLPRSHPPVPPGISTVVLPRKSLFLIKPGHHGHCAQRPGPSLPSTCPKEEGPRPRATPGCPIPAEALGAGVVSEVRPPHLPFSSFPHPAPLTSPSEELGFGVGKMSLGFSQIQYPLEPKPISLAQGPAIEGLSLLFKPPRAQLL